MNEYPPLDERYLEWLHSLVEPSDRRHHARYRKLCEQLYITPFLWFVPNDDNRIEDARELRREFFAMTGEEDRLWYEMDASILEVLIALSRRVAFELDEAPAVWFWRMIGHLGLSYAEDHGWTRLRSREVRRVTDRLIHRTYRSDGHGGLFPLNHPYYDQRTVEIWDQMSAYVLELMD